MTRLAPFAVVAGLVVFVVLSEHTICVFANLTGKPCPGCGLTRAAIALLSGDFRLATRLHPLVWVCCPLLGLLAAEGIAWGVTGKRINLTNPPGMFGRWLNVFWVGFACALVALWLARMFGAFGGPVTIKPLWTGLGT